MSLTDFLLARLDEDEERAGSGWSRPGSGRWLRTNEGQSILAPGAMLADVTAKRRIVEHCEPDALTLSPGDDYVLRLLALPYSDHPGYREEWRP